MAKAKVTSTDRTTSVTRPPQTISADDRRRMIAEAAYYRAERRGFANGDPVTDWLAAEAEIEGRLNRIH